MDLSNLFPPYLNNDFELISSILPSAQFSPHLGVNSAFIGEEKVIVDCRLYNQWPDNIDSVSDIQRKILNALYTKHHDGYIRERSLGNIINLDDEWIPPFIFSLLGEYVIEIVNIINENRKSLVGKKSYSAFINNNPDFLKLIESRCISYWNCYYRHRKYKYKDEYPGIICLNNLRENAK